MKNISPFSLRTKLILNFLSVILLGGILTLFFGTRLVKSTIISQAQLKVKHDLASAWMVYNEKLNDIKDIVRLNAAREGIKNALKINDKNTLMSFLDRMRLENKLDILTLTDNNGKVIVRTRNPQHIGDNQSEDEIIKKALKKEISAGTQIITNEELKKEGEDLAQKAYMKLIPTPKAAPRIKNVETSGTMLKAAAPVLDENNKLLGVLYGGILLNRNYEIVDRVKEIVFKEEKYKDKDIGTATIFQNDFRISTNVKTKEGQRAICTLLSEEVNRAVLKEGKAWIDRAFVVTDWYITAYEPIKNIDGNIIGILYVGMLEAPYIDLIRRVMATFVGIALLCIILLLTILNFTTSKIIKPLQRIVWATKKIASEDFSHRINTNSKDEIGILAESFNQMTEDLERTHKELYEWGKLCEQKVEERTKELRDIQAHLIQSEKLASLGKMAAGIAHEVNNPLGSILIYSHLLLEETGDKSPYSENLKKIIKETNRCKNIVKGLLEFARPKEPEMTLVSINEIIEKSLEIMERHELFQNISIKKSLTQTLPMIMADGAQLQQVFINIILNAAEAMNGQGNLLISSSIDRDNKHIEIEFTDTGCGIAEENIGRLFEPFFTTKQEGKGTGLGLAISYSIINRHEGDIIVKSEVGKGSTFIIKLPIKMDK